MHYFILLSLHVGMIAVVVGTALAAHNNWTRGNLITSILGGLHSSMWFLAWVGLSVESFGGII
jgi:hypothetical protein